MIDGDDRLHHHRHDNDDIIIVIIYIYFFSKPQFGSLLILSAIMTCPFETGIEIYGKYCLMYAQYDILENVSWMLNEKKDNVENINK